METEDVQSQLEDRIGNIVPVPVVAMVPLIAQVNCVNTTLTIIILNLLSGNRSSFSCCISECSPRGAADH